VITRGKKIFYTRGVTVLDVDYLIEQVRFRVRNDLYNNFYTVTVSKFLHPGQVSVRCQCPYNLGDICRHEVAALFQLTDLLQTGFFKNTEVTYDQQHTIVRMRDINPQLLRLFSSAEIMDQAGVAAAARTAEISYARNEKVVATVPDGDTSYEVTIVQNEDRYFDTSCGCGDVEHPVCVHKMTVFLQLMHQHGPQYFRTLQNWDDQKNKLLRLYGYSLNDDLTDKFDFTYENGKPFLRVLDPSIKKVNGSVPAAAPVEAEIQVAEPSVREEPKFIGLVLDAKADWYPHCGIELVTGEADENTGVFLGKTEKLELDKYINTDAFRESEHEWIALARKCQPEELVRYLKKNLPFGDFIGDYHTVLKDQIQDELFKPLWEYLLPKYRTLLQRNTDNPRCFVREQGKVFNTASLKPVVFAAIPVVPVLYIAPQGKQINLRLVWEIEGEEVPFDKVHMLNAALLQYGNKIYSLAHTAEVAITERFLPAGQINVPMKQWNDMLGREVVHWRKQVQIHFADELVQATSSVAPVYRLYMQEQGETLQLKPAFVYNGVEARPGDAPELIMATDGKVNIVERDLAAERMFTNMLQELHSNMIYSSREQHFFLQSKYVMADSWFFTFSDKMQEWNVDIHGYDQLKSFRINRYKPETKINVSSGIDWFETSVEVAFGDQVISIADVKKALSRKENYVKLADGTIGLLPEAMVRKFGLLTKMGEVKDNKLRLKKIHFSILDELLADVDEGSLQQELEEKKERLDRIIDNDYSNIKAPENLKAILRPYQQAGFQWLMFLKEAGWGGILADDMGLGKTVQTLSWLAHYKNENPEAKFLVVCPTTLMFNWEKEIQKFTPDLKPLIHHGPKRASSLAAFEPYDVIITSYGTIRSDIKILVNFQFDYAVLDESQAIKNPKSLATKAASLINAKHKLALSGTPIQNNTFDLYAQMNFLNPGMLGGREFFMNEFAVPIDKFQETEAKQQLKKLIYPFLLRRTKNQVAKELPEKTETVLFCEMGKDQRKIYEAYRSNYQAKILGMIEEQGLERSQFHILQGLTRLRQICDSPALINEEEKFGNYSIKLDELTRELEENTGNHKALVFSQFLGMLALIREGLRERGIPFVYFDGSSSAAERERAIKEFQENDDCRVFLISLKAGGVGLNLTAADYVYIVDPWWNPAVEQQAIDRTHRIGQTKNIFAYRFICKDTIEEKMLVLQERKRSLAEDLISDDSAILKRLTREDIAYLFS
jgi:non-specific serine/threonine protein kinase